MDITILNSSVLSVYGIFVLQAISLSDAKKLVKRSQVFSVIGHSATAEILTELLEIKVFANRIEYSQPINTTALVFKLKSRIPEGKILSRAEIEEIGYEFGILRRLK